MGGRSGAPATPSNLGRPSDGAQVLLSRGAVPGRLGVADPDGLVPIHDVGRDAHRRDARGRDLLVIGCAPHDLAAAVKDLPFDCHGSVRSPHLNTKLAYFPLAPGGSALPSVAVGHPRCIRVYGIRLSGGNRKETQMSKRAL